MSPDETFTPSADLGIEVPLTELGKRLKQIWQTGDTKTKAALMNFAIYSEEVNSLAANTEVIREVTREHACRALLIAADPAAPAVSVRAWITAHCQLSAAGKKSVCSEQIAFLISGQSPNLVPSTVFSWLESDLPLTFWWQGEFSPRWEPHLYAVIDRLVIDSGAWRDPLPQLRRLEQAWLDDAGGFTVNDLTWTRVLHLRLAIASAFDEPGTQEHLAALTEIRIDYGTGHRLAAKLLAAWMMHQASWTLQPGRTSHEPLVLQQGDRTIRLIFREVESPRPVPRLDLSGPHGVISLTHETGNPFISTAIRLTTGTTEHLTPCPSETPAELVTERLRRGCKTKRYFTLLATVRGLLGEV
jgi:glucose-6-phosphate dehydrogenase assembly protein OpcA